MSEDVKDTNSKTSNLNIPTDISNKDTIGEVEEKNIDFNNEESKKDKKKRRRRRNYDDYDAEIDKEEQESKKSKNNNKNSDSDIKTGSNVTLNQLSDSDIDDEKLDQLKENE